MEAALLATHATFVACALLFGGTAFFGAYVLPRAGAAPQDRVRIRRVAASALAGAASALLAWTLVETATLAGDLGGLGIVLRQTLFGHLVLLQAAALLLGAALLRAGFVPGCLAAGLLLVLEAAHGHGMAMGRAGLPLVVAGALHLFAGAVWVGGLPPLLLLVAAAPLKVAGRAARWFSPPGRLAVVVLALTALAQAKLLVGSAPALTSTRYGVLVLVKTLLFLLLLAGACLNRYRFGPALAGPRAVGARRRLVATIVVQTVCGVVAILAAVILGSSTPGMDMGRG